MGFFYLIWQQPLGLRGISNNISFKKVVLIAAVYAFSGLSVPGVPPPVVGVQQALAAPVAIPLPTSCILLLNMFDPQK